jgi:hypothetical protein
VRYQVALAVAFLAVFASFLATVHSGQASHAINSTLHYSFKNGTCTEANRVDPVTIVFWNLATTDRVNQNINQHTDLDHGASPNAQHFGTSGQCLGQTVDKSSCAQVACTRWHIRGRLAAASHAVYGTTTQSTPHHEDWVLTCFPPNHAVDKGGVSEGTSSGFDQGRDHILSGFLIDGHVQETVYWGNTQEFPQCDGDLAGSLGWVYYIKISHGH